METESCTPTSPIAERLKQEDGSTPPGEGRSSPPPNCAICLGSCRNKSFTDSCLHQFCFNCLVTWSKIKAECPLCKQTFKSIIHNVRSNLQYEEYMVEQQAAEVEALPVEDVPDNNRRFRYRTTITFPRSEGSAIQRLLIRHVEGTPPPRPDAFGHRRPFRQVVYRHNLWARLLPDFTGRLRDSTPEFFRANEAQKYRLVPWLNRELEFLLCANHGHMAYVMARILDLLPVCSITSAEFRSAMLPFFGERTEHFLHELLCFASTPYDMLGYDRNVQYGPDPRLGANINHVISSSESDTDSDIVVVAPQPPLEPPPQYIIPIETISHSDTEDSSSEVIVTGYIKPPQDRTPEVVDLLASDSDVLVQENSPPPSTSRQIPSASALVKLTLSRRLHPPDSDSDEEYIPRKRSKKRYRSQESASTTSTRRDTSAPSDASWNLSENGTSTTLSLHSWDSDERSYTPPLEDLRRTRSKGKKESKSEQRRKLKKRRAKSQCRPREEHLDGTRKKKKESKKSKRSKEKSTHSRTSDRDKPGTSGLGKCERGKKLRSVICTLPISSFTGRLTEVSSSRNTSRSAELGGNSLRSVEKAHNGNSSRSEDIGHSEISSRSADIGHIENSSRSADIGNSGNSSRSADIGHSGNSSRSADIGHNENSSRLADIGHSEISTRSADRGHSENSSRLADIGHSSISSRSADIGHDGNSSQSAEVALNRNSPLTVQLSNLSETYVDNTYNSDCSTSGSSVTKPMRSGRRRALSSSDSEDDLPLNLTIKK